MSATTPLVGLRVGLRFASIAPRRSGRPGAGSPAKLPGNVLVVFEVTS